MYENQGWEIDIPKTMKKYEAADNEPHYPGMPGGGFYPDSRFYRKNKPAFTLKDDGRVYRPRKEKASL